MKKKGIPLGWIAAVAALVIVAAALLVLVGVLLGGKSPLGSPFGPAASPAWTMVEEVLPAAEYTGLIYRYTRVAENAGSRNIRGLRLPLTTKKYLVVYDGTLKLGIDGRDLRVEEAGDVIQITMPPVRILSHQIHEETTRVYDQTFNIFNQIKLQDFIDFTAQQKAEVEAQVEKDEALRSAAQVSIEDAFGGLIRGLPAVKNNYRVLFTWAETAPPLGSASGPGTEAGP